MEREQLQRECSCDVDRAGIKDKIKGKRDYENGRGEWRRHAEKDGEVERRQESEGWREEQTADSRQQTTEKHKRQTDN